MVFQIIALITAIAGLAALGKVLLGFTILAYIASLSTAQILLLIFGIIFFIILIKKIL